MSLVKGRGRGSSEWKGDPSRSRSDGEWRTGAAGPSAAYATNHDTCGSMREFFSRWMVEFGMQIDGCYFYIHIDDIILICGTRYDFSPNACVSPYT